MIASLPPAFAPFPALPRAAQTARQSAPARSETPAASYGDWLGASLVHLYALGQSTEPSEPAAPRQTAPQPIAQRPVVPRPDLRVCLAAPYNVPSLSVPEGHRYRVRLLPGCFDESLRQVAAGITDVRLQVNHDDARPLARIRDGGFALFSAATGLYLTLRSPALVSAMDQHHHLPAMSVGCRALDSAISRDERGPVIDYRVAELFEVSLVEHAAFPGTYADVIANMRRDAVENLRSSRPASYRVKQYC